MVGFLVRALDAVIRLRYRFASLIFECEDSDSASISSQKKYGEKWLAETV